LRRPHGGKPTKLTQQEIIAKARPAIVKINGLRGDDAIRGTGWIIDAKKGLVLTAQHVIRGATGLRATINDRERVPLQVVASCPCQDDLALLKLTRVPPHAGELQLARADRVRAGDRIYVLGYPRGAQQWGHETLTTAPGTIVNPRVNHVYLGGELPRFSSMLAADAAAAVDGASGAPLVNPHGEVVGMAELGGDRDELYATGVATIRQRLPELMSGSRRTDLGLEVSPLQNVSLPDVFANDPDYYDQGGRQLGRVVARYLDAEGIDGLYVAHAADGSPADKAGLGYGMVIESADGTETTTFARLCRILESKSPGDTVTIGLVMVNGGTKIEDIGDRFTVKVRMTR
jgi:S1-C subfamily serine protease